MPSLIELFQQHGSRKIVHRGELVSLQQEGKVFAIETGAFDVVVRPRAFFLGTCNQGLMFSINDENVHQIFAQCTNDAVLWEWNESALEQSGVQAEVRLLRQQWAAVLCSKLFPAAEPQETWSTVFWKELGRVLETQQSLEKAALETRAEEEQASLDFALKQMQNVLVPSTAAAVKESQDALTQACQILAEYQKISLVFPKNPSLTVNERLLQIAEASRIQMRRITLGKTWWKESHGALLGFYGPDEHPVAILPTASYKLVDAKQELHVTDQIGQACSRTAYMLYRPFPEFIRTGKEMLFLVMKQCSSYFSALALFSVISGLVVFFPPVAAKLLFAYAIPESNPSLVGYLTAGLVFSAVGLLYFYCVRNFLFLKIEGVASHFVQTAFWNRLLSMPPQFFRKFTAGNLFMRVNATEEMRKLINLHGALFTMNLFSAAVYALILFLYAPFLASVVTGIALFSLLMTILIARFSVKLWIQIFAVQGRVRGIVIQMIEGIGKLRVAGAEQSALAYWAVSFAKSKSLQMRLKQLQDIGTTGIAFLSVLTVCLVYLAMLMKGGIDHISLSSFLAFQIALGGFSLAFYSLHAAVLDLVKIVAHWEQTKPIFEEPMEEQKQKLDPGSLTGDIHLDSIIFSYDPLHQPVLNGLTLAIRPKEFVAIIGKSGSGKSTLIRLLLGFEKPQEGAVYFDGKDLASLDPRKVRKQMGVVFQGEGILAGNLYENLVGSTSCTEEELERALQLSGFDQDLSQLPMGLHTMIPMNGTTLSGGQKQRLLLARALLGNPPILILDEATSALDSQSQDTVSRHIEQLPITRIVVAQRLSTIKKADRIYVIDQGQVVQSGHFAELAEAPGLFAEMLKRQRL